MFLNSGQCILCTLGAECLLVLCYQLFRVPHVSLAAFSLVKKNSLIMCGSKKNKNKNLGLWIKMDEPFLALVLILIKPFPTFAHGLHVFAFLLTHQFKTICFIASPIFFS